MKKRKLLAALLSAAMVITSAAVPVLADSTNWKYHDGDQWVDADVWMDHASEARVGDDYTVDDSGNVTIQTALGLAWFADDVTYNKNDYKDKTVELSDNIDLTGHLWAPIAPDILGPSFKGTFDGNKHTIKGFSQKPLSNSDYGLVDLGLFAQNDGTIQNLNIKGKIESIGIQTRNVGGIAAATSGSSKIENCKSSISIEFEPPGDAKTTLWNYMGGIVANADAGVISNCEYNGELTISIPENVEITKEAYCGGIVGYANHGTEIIDCSNSGKITQTGPGNGDYKCYVGGIGGRAAATLSECVNDGEIIAKSSYCVGGIAGECVLMNDCENNGKIQAESSKYVGGIFGGNLAGAGNVTNCTNNGKVEATNSECVGGIGGHQQRITAENCTNTGDITCTADKDVHVGGIFGCMVNIGYNSTGPKNCANIGDITCTIEGDEGKGYVGGITGNVESSYTGYASDCTNTGDIVCSGGSEGYAGGIFGKSDLSAFDCTNTGDITVDSQTGYAGGILGDLNDSFDMERNTNSGDVTLGDNTKSGYAGGIAGHLQGDANLNLFMENTSVGEVNAPDDVDDMNTGYLAGWIKEDWIEDNSFVSRDENVPAFGNLTEEQSESYYKKYDTLEDYDEANRTDITVSLKTSLEDITLAEESNPSKAYIVLSADDTKKIYRYMSSEFTFNINDPNGEYVITPYENNVITDLGEVDASEGASHRYGFNLDGDRDRASISGENIIIGEIELVSTGSYTVKVVDGKVQTAKWSASDVDDNIVYTYSYNSDSALDNNKLHIGGVDGEGPNNEWNLENTPVEKELTINVMFPNEVKEQAADYTNMTVSLHSALDTVYPIDDIVLGTGVTYTTTGDYAQYTATRNIVTDTRYTLTFKGDGYRTYSVDVVIPEGAVSPTVEVWNNVMDDKGRPVVTYKPSSDEDPVELKTAKDGTTFLAGDIDDSKLVDIYDLSAAVAYFGKTGMDTHTTPGEGDEVTYDDADYIRYDLNRDGNIDSKDIAMVLVSWGK